MMFLNSKKIFQSMGSEYSLRRDWKLPGISYLTDLRRNRCAKNIPKTELKTRFKTKEITYTLISYNTLWSLFQTTQRGIFSVSGIWIEDYLRNLTWRERFENRFGLSTPKLRQNQWFFSTHTNFFVIFWVVLSDPDSLPLRNRRFDYHPNLSVNLRPYETYSDWLLTPVILMRWLIVG
jgi:hypothetical protein